jgi:tetratricopeptide (TPR) repeat protein
MRTHLFRGGAVAVGTIALAALLFPAAPAFAQSVVRGIVVDAQGKPVPGAEILFEAVDANRKMTGKSDNKGEFLQVGLQSGSYKITASKEGIGTETVTAPVRQGPNAPLKFTLMPAARAFASEAAAKMTDAQRQEAALVQKLAAEAQTLRASGQLDPAIAKFNELVVKVPTCTDCYMSLGQIYKEQKKDAEAEAAFKKVVELKPDHGGAYSELATMYNAQKKFDLAADASANAAKYLGAAGGAAGAEAMFNQGVIAFNAGKFQEARVSFESATKSDPTMGQAFYQLGMTTLNLGDFAAAVAALEQYLKVDPNGAKAAEVKAQLPALQSMVKK